MIPRQHDTDEYMGQNTPHRRRKPQIKTQQGPTELKNKSNRQTQIHGRAQSGKYEDKSTT